MPRPKFFPTWFIQIRLRRGRLRIVIYARYSTEEQNPQTIDDQVARCKRFLESVGIDLKQCEIVIISDEALSGELTSRPGIDKVIGLIETGQVDWVVSEEASRFFRVEGPSFDFFGLAVDRDVRLVCLNDQIDTADGDAVWEEQLIHAIGHHAKSNRLTVQRVIRALIARHEMGAALGPVRPGYLRDPRVPASLGEPAKGPFFDRVDARWREVIRTVFEKIADGLPAWLVAEWLTHSGLPKTSNAQLEEWTATNVNALIRNRIYIGKGIFRVTISKKIRATGKRKQVRNNEEDVLVREIPDLRIVSDSLFKAANDQIDLRCTREDIPRGADHPLSGVPRDSRGPLTKMMICDACGEPMHINGRQEGAYRCRSLQHQSCWNRATAEKSLTHERIGESVSEVLLSSKPRMEELVSRVRLRLENSEQIEKKLSQLNDQRDELTKWCENLSDGIRVNGVSDTLMADLKRNEAQKADVEMEIASLTDELNHVTVPSTEEMADRLAEMASRIKAMERDARGDLMTVVDEIRVVPYQQFGDNKVVLRAHLRINPVGALPWAVRNFLDAIPAGDSPELTDRFKTEIVIDLFKPSNSPRYAMEVAAMRKRGLKFDEISAKLDVGDMVPKRAMQLAKQMVQADITDPFVRLFEPPENASRWRPEGRDGNHGKSIVNSDAA